MELDLKFVAMKINSKLSLVLKLVLNFQIVRRNLKHGKTLEPAKQQVIARAVGLESKSDRENVLMGVVVSFAHGMTGMPPFPVKRQELNFLIVQKH